MKSSTENLLAMATATSRICHQKLTLIPASNVYKSALAEIDHRIAAIKTFKQAKLQNAKSMALKKKNARNAAITASLAVLTGVAILANSTENDGLIAKVELYKSKLSGCGDQTSIEMLCQLSELARLHAIALNQYGIDTLILEDLETRIEIFKESMFEPRIQLAKIKSVIGQINALSIGLLDMFKYKLDVIVESLQESNSEFYKEYFQSRIIADSKTGVTGITEDNISRIKLRFVKITILEKGAKRKTSKYGKFTFRRLAPGKYTVKVEAPGYEDLIVPDVKVDSGHITDLDLHLKKNAA